MNRVCDIKKERLENLLKEGKTTRQISKILGISSNNTISRYIHMYGLENLYQNPKYPPYHLNKVEDKETAYLLGFIIADSSIKNEQVEISVGTKDLELAQYLSKILGVKYHEDNTLVKEKRRFPRIRITRKIIGINKFIGKDKKKERNVPIINKNLEVYLVRGLFDADGCITWGFRKDRGRLWHKISFTSSLKILTSLQKILYKIGISTTIFPKSDKEDCFVLSFNNKKDILKFYDYLYADKEFVPLKRKFDKFNALRLELGEFSENIDNTTLSCASDLSGESAETTGELNGVLNNQNSTQDLYK